ncbi:MAG TPA: cell division protein ZapB [Thermoanaerobaculia bacterium]|nr:cell division protein ZapB [Thermoanaerobaculia bacterium]HSN86864.1 cell division protein ZapB [Thermoanaerobaculia bacterium]
MDIEWLDSLETRVRGAAERLRDLKEENGTLRERIRELEERLATAESGQGEAGSWVEEREEIRRRVEALTLRLEELAEV